MSKRTPMLEQYLETKRESGDALLFFRLGDFYELFNEDALVASQALELTLTGRGQGENRMPMCGVPHHAADAYIGRLVAAGHKVAICDQVEDPKAAKGLVRRAIVRIVTPGTGYDFLRESDGRILLATALPAAGVAGDADAEGSAGGAGDGSAAAETGEWTAAALDPMTGEAWLRTGAWEAVADWLAGQPIAEIVVHGALHADGGARLDELAARLGCALSAFHEAPDLERATAHGLLIAYAERMSRRDLAHVREPLELAATEYMHLGATAKANLELVAPAVASRQGSTLLEVIDFTKTAMGRRRLRAMIECPFAALAPILSRQAAVGQLLEDEGLRASLRELLQGMLDLSRMASRVSYGTAAPRDLRSVAAILQRATQLRARLAEQACAGDLAQTLDKLRDLTPLAERIVRTLVEDPPGSGKDGGIIAARVDGELDRLRAVARGGRSAVAALEQEERARTGIKSLKITFHRVFGYCIEVTSSNAHLVPGDFERRQTLAGSERFVTPRLREVEREILTADDRSRSLEWEYFVQLQQAVLEELDAIQDVAEAIGELDALQSLAEAARTWRYTRPQVTEGDELVIVGGRHPVVERRAGAEYVANDLSLSAQRRIAVLTGPNMAGKSTFMRQAALIVLLAQAGSFVPAKEATVGLVDKLFTRIGASDDVAGGMSTFMVEMSETADILRQATERSLIVFDEVGRGTATYDGMSIAEALLEHVHDHIGARTLFATHYHELTVLCDRLPRMFNLSAAVALHGGQLVFLHRIVDRPADRSYGVQVAQKAGLPETVTARAALILQRLEAAAAAAYEAGASGQAEVSAGLAEATDPADVTRLRAAGGAGDGAHRDARAANRAAEREQVWETRARAILELDLDGMTPRDIQAFLYEWRAGCLA